jgi:copper homeostasis protein
MVLEACVETFEEALMAEARGAHRIELCDNLRVGGTTPSYALLQSVRDRLHIPIMVMVRPRGGNFIYNDRELKVMKQNIDICKSLNVSGVVLGILDRDNRINISNTAMLAAYAAPLEVTFHKAIDETVDPVKSVLALKNINGITRVLTSGGKPTALEGAEGINKMISSAGNSLKILAAGRITNENLVRISEILNTDEFHGRRIVGNLR